MGIAFPKCSLSLFIGEIRILSPGPRNLYAAYTGFSKDTVSSNWIHGSLKVSQGDVALPSAAGETQRRGMNMNGLPVDRRGEAARGLEIGVIVTIISV